MKLEELIKAYKAIEENKGELPEEFGFLLTPEFKEKLKEVKDSADAIMLAAELLGDQIGQEKVTEEKVDELAGVMKDEGLLPEKKEGEVGEEEMEADTEKPEADEEKAPPLDNEEPGEIRGQQEGQENVEEINPEEVVGAKGEEKAAEGEEEPVEIKPALVDGKPTIDGNEAPISEAPIGEGGGGDAIEVPPETVKERAMAAIGALLVKK